MLRGACPTPRRVAGLPERQRRQHHHLLSAPASLAESVQELGYYEGDLPVAESVSKRILPLPMYPELTDAEVNHVIATIRRFFKAT